MRKYAVLPAVLIAVVGLAVIGWLPMETATPALPAAPTLTAAPATAPAPVSREIVITVVRIEAEPIPHKEQCVVVKDAY